MVFLHLPINRLEETSLVLTYLLGSTLELSSFSASNLSLVDRARKESDTNDRKEPGYNRLKV